MKDEATNRKEDIILNIAGDAGIVVINNLSLMVKVIVNPLRILILLIRF